MWRFVLLSFVFMALAFYELSGGADYTPASNSLQARARSEDRLPNVIKLAEASAGAEVSRGMTALEEVGTGLVPVKLTLGRAVDPRIVVPTVTARPAVPVKAVPIETATPAALPAEPEPNEDRRRVAGNAVNLRAGPGTAFGRTARLERDTEVVVLRDPGEGWVKLRVVETGRVGWMAAKLLMAAN